MVQVKNHIDKISSEIKFIFSEESLDVIFELLGGELSFDDLKNRLNMIQIKLKIVLYKLIELGVILISKEKIIKDKRVVYFKLNKLKLNEMVKSYDYYKKKLNIVFSSFNNMKIFNNGINSLLKNINKPHENLAIIVKSNNYEIEKFKKELKKMIEKFINKNYNNEEEYFMFMPILLPYKIVNNKKLN